MRKPGSKNKWKKESDLDLESRPAVFGVPFLPPIAEINNHRAGVMVSGIFHAKGQIVHMWDEIDFGHFLNTYHLFLENAI